MSERVKEVESFCKELVKEYLPDYTFKINPRLSSTNGRCNYTTRTIEMSQLLAERGKDADILNNIVHEIAHGLHPFTGHSTAWRNTYIKLGGNGQRCNSYEGVSKERTYRYKITCTGCNTQTNYQRVPKIKAKLHRYMCKHCRTSTLQFAEI